MPGQLTPFHRRGAPGARAWASDEWGNCGIQSWNYQGWRAVEWTRPFPGAVALVTAKVKAAASPTLSGAADSAMGQPADHAVGQEGPLSVAILSHPVKEPTALGEVVNLPNANWANEKATTRENSDDN